MVGATISGATLHLELIMSLNDAKTLEGVNHPKNEQSCGQHVVKLY